MFSIVKVACDQTQPGSLLARPGGKIRELGWAVVSIFLKEHSYSFAQMLVASMDPQTTAARISVEIA